MRLAANDEIELVISEDVILETRRNIELKAPELTTLFERLLDVLKPEIVPGPSKRAVRTAEHYVAKKDAFIIAAAIDANIDYVATFDRRHLIDPPEVSLMSGLDIQTPGTILNHLRSEGN